MKGYVASNVDEEVADSSTSATTPSVSVDDESDDLSLTNFLKIVSPEVKVVLNENPPDIIASDIHRPGKKGFKMIIHLISSPQTFTDQVKKVLK
jgi:hypothetical protein